MQADGARVRTGSYCVSGTDGRQAGEVTLVTLSLTRRKQADFAVLYPKYLNRP